MSEIERMVQSIAERLSLLAIVDIAIVSYLIYKLLQLIRGSRAFQMVVGTLVLVALFFASQWAELSTVNWLLQKSLAYVGFAVIVLYQQELRRALAAIGQAPLFRFLNPSSSTGTLDEIAFTVRSLAQRRLGALIVLERGVGLRGYVEGGILLDAVVNYDLLLSIFNPKSPLHDGAVVIQGDRIASAACFLPISINQELSKELGTRHRAAIGITEDTDALAIVVSEETGRVSLVEDGAIDFDLPLSSLASRLKQAMERERGEKALSPEAAEPGGVER